MRNKAPIVILHIEDDPAHRLLVSKTLTNHGLTNSVMEAEDGQEGLDYLYGVGKYADRKTYRLPRLILLDINMPRMDGFEVLKKIKNDPDLKAIPVIMLSTSARDEEITRGYELGANAYLTKPISFGDFVTKLENFQFFWTITAEVYHGRNG
jgi:CheY-like chemotaxis protein